MLERQNSASLIGAPGATLAIGCFASICRDPLADALLAFARACPEVSVGVQEMARPALLSALRAGRIALAVMPGDVEPALWSMELWQDHVIAAMAVGHPLARHDPVTPDQLLGQLFLMPREHHGGEMHRFLAQRTFPAGRTPRASILDLDPARIMGQVALGRGLALACASQWDAGDRRLITRRVDAPGAAFPVRAHWARADPPWPLTELISLL